MTTLKGIMTKDLTTVGSQATIKDVAQKMKQGDIGNVLLMDGDKLAGIVTDRDLVIRAVADGQHVSAPVSSFATKNVFTMPSSTDVSAAAKAMAEKQLRRLPVTDGDTGKVVGSVSLADLSNRTDGNADKKALEGISKPN